MTIFGKLLISLFSLFSLGYVMNKKNKNMNFFNCFKNKILLPLNKLVNAELANETFIIEDIKDDHVVVNTKHKTLYAIELSGYSTIEERLSENTLTSLYDYASKIKEGFIYQVFFKDKNYQKHYIFCYSKTILEVLGEPYDLKPMNGKQIADVLFDLFLGNSFYLKNKELHRQLNIAEDETVSFSPYKKTFNKILKNNIFNNLNRLEVFQGYRIKKSVLLTNYSSLFSLNFKGAIWSYYDFNKERNYAFAKSMYDQRKFYGGKEPFEQYLNMVDRGAVKALTCNYEIIAEENTSISTINKISEILNIEFIKKKNKIYSSITKSMLKYRDTRFDIPAPLEFLNGRIATIHKKNRKNSDIYGEDSKICHINFSFSQDNDNPHSVLIAPTGSGKSVAKQKMNSQMLEIDFKTGYAKKLGLTGGMYGVRNFDVGFSDKPTFDLIHKNEKNNTGEIQSTLSNFRFNLLNFELDENGLPIAEDIQFTTDLISMILESQNMDGTQGLTIQEMGKFKEIILTIFKKNEFQNHKISSTAISDKLREKLFNYGYTNGTFLKDIQEDEFSFLKVPLLNDVIKLLKIRKQNQQIDEREREAYSTLLIKLEDVDSLKYFSQFDEFKIKDTAYIYSELNSIKESSLFVPMFFGIFWKIYIKDRDRAIKLKNKKENLPKLIYIIEESSNHFRFKTFETMFEKLVYEARKYNIHMMFVIQNAEEIPYTIFKNINTRIFLFPPVQKEDIISYVKTTFKADDKVIETMKKSKQYELVIWYSKGVMNMKFSYTKEELALFSTDPNNVNKN